MTRTLAGSTGLIKKASLSVLPHGALEHMANLVHNPLLGFTYYTHTHLTPAHQRYPPAVPQCQRPGMNIKAHILLLPSLECANTLYALPICMSIAALVYDALAYKALLGAISS